MHSDRHVQPAALQQPTDPLADPFGEPMPRSPFGRDGGQPTPAPLDETTPRRSIAPDDAIGTRQPPPRTTPDGAGAPGRFPEPDPFAPRTDETMPDSGLPPLDPQPAGVAADPKEDCATALRNLKSNRINITTSRAILDLRPPEGGEIPYECTLGSERFALDSGRQWAETCYTWKASGLCHKPLYFEQSHMERYGHSWGPVLDPVLSGAHFFGSVPLLPYNMGLEPPGECIYPLGHYRPGNCAPRYIEPWPWSIRAAAAQAGAAAGLISVLP